MISPRGPAAEEWGRGSCLHRQLCHSRHSESASEPDPLHLQGIPLNHWKVTERCCCLSPALPDTFYGPFPPRKALFLASPIPASSLSCPTILSELQQWSPNQLPCFSPNTQGMFLPQVHRYLLCLESSFQCGCVAWYSAFL